MKNKISIELKYFNVYVPMCRKGRGMCVNKKWHMCYVNLFIKLIKKLPFMQQAFH